MTEVNDPNGETDAFRPFSPNKKGGMPLGVRHLKHLFDRYIVQPALRLINWLDCHDGIVTAAATVVAIAVLTYSLSRDSSRQADTINNQLEIMQGQLTTMEADQRPWLRVDLHDPEWQQAGQDLMVALKATVTNVGKQPAINSSIKTIQDREWYKHPAEAIRADIERQRHDPLRRGNTIFPGNCFKTPGRIGVNLKGSQFLSPTQADFKFGGYVEYFSRRDGEPHFSPFVFHISVHPDPITKETKTEIIEDFDTVDPD